MRLGILADIHENAELLTLALRRMDSGFVARALDDSGLVFENNMSNTLAEAMAALEEGLAGRIRDHEAALRSSPQKVKTRQRRLHHDA